MTLFQKTLFPSINLVFWEIGQLSSNSDSTLNFSVLHFIIISRWTLSTLTYAKLLILSHTTKFLLSSGPLVSLVVYYTSSRHILDKCLQFVLDGHFSGRLPVTSGIPQGSILGPLLFIIYINDLPSLLVSSFPYLFPDDTKCYMCIPKPSDSISLQLDLDHLFLMELWQRFFLQTLQIWSSTFSE